MELVIRFETNTMYVCMYVCMYGLDSSGAVTGFCERGNEPSGSTDEHVAFFITSS
jgi:hypothetical protein